MTAELIKLICEKTWVQCQFQFQGRLIVFQVSNKGTRR